MEQNTIRVHELDVPDWRKRVIEVIKNIPGEVFMVREVDAARPHYQAYVCSSLKRQAITIRLKKALPELKGNGTYGVGSRDIESREKYLRYLCKGQSAQQPPEVLLRCGLEFTDEWVATEHKAYWEANAELKKKNKTAKLGLMEQLREYAATLPSSASDHRKKIAERYVDLCIEIDKPINVFYARQVVNTVCARLYPNYKDELVYSIIEKM